MLFLYRSFLLESLLHIYLLRLMRSQGVKVDSVSLGEIGRALFGRFSAGQLPAITSFIPPICWIEPTLARGL
ncbi:hypothetical protein [Sodalis-like endosymbiont of Proechinophthirus fluctus]|uniref:hypothetical protein n=1 Tax=Sodalis-like endosymbiont of Proechinophthirus fluctus TaxID=1462730 RepID=UPI00082A38ED|nr:hypothetical protein [Sodalis-like endosymbiont of Proechinophthirus fluctus]